MKRLLKLSAGLIMIGLLAGCGLQDGTYTATTANADSLGYRAYLTVTVSDGLISAAEFDALDPDGMKKSEDKEYARLMQAACGTTPEEIGDHYRQLLVDAKSFGQVDVDAVSGATVSSQEFARLWQALKKPMASGDTSLVTLGPAPEFVRPDSGEYSVKFG